MAGETLKGKLFWVEYRFPTFYFRGRQVICKDDFPDEKERVWVEVPHPHYKCLLQIPIQFLHPDKPPPFPYNN